MLGTGGDTVIEFTPGDGDKIRVADFTGAIPGSVEAFLTAANLRVEKGHISVGEDSEYDSTTIENTAIYRGDTLLMVLRDFDADLTLDMFDLPNATANSTPVFAQDSYSASIERGAEIGDIITNIAATDADGDTLTYSITAGNDSGLFIVDITNGDIKLAVPDTKTDAGDHTLTITATDTAGNTDTATVTITDYAIRGTDGDDVFTLSNAEDAPNTYIYGYGGADTIRGDGGTYILDGGYDDDTIYGSDGALDILKGGDGNDTLYGRSGFDIIRGGRGNDTLNGGGGADFLSGSLDDDTLNGGDGGDLLVGGYGADIFVLNTADSGADIIAEFTPDDGDKIRMEEFDGVMPASVDAFLTAANLRVEKGHISAEWRDQTLFTDKASSENTAIYKGDALVMVLVDFTDDLTLDMFDLPNATANSAPVFAQESYNVDIARGAEIGDIITNIAATDADGDTLTYAITAGNDVGLFIVDATNGDIKLAVPDARTNPATHTLTVEALDSAGNPADVSVTVTDPVLRGTNDDDVLTIAPISIEDVPENSSEGQTTIYGYGGDDTLRSGDRSDVLHGGAGNDTLHGGAGEWDILRGGDGNDTLYGAGGSDLLEGDRGDDTLYGGSGSDHIGGGYGADIFVLNTADSGIDSVFDFTPSDGDKIRMAEFNGTMPATIEAFLAAANLRVEQNHIKADVWEGSEHRNLLSDDSKIANTAIYKVVDGVDDVLVMVLEDFTDDLTLDMFDLPNATTNSAPKFAQESYSARLAENAATGSAVVTVQATDADAGDTLTYSIVSNNIPGLFVEDTIIDNVPPFAINNDGEITLTGALDYETATSHTITVQVKDSAGLTDTAEVTINVTDANEAPVFTQDSYSTAIRFSDHGTPVVVSATDAEGDAVTYAITAGNDAGFFDIDGEGSISFGAPDVPIHADAHTLTVTATDTAGNSATATVTITDGIMRGTDGEDSMTGSDESDFIYGDDGNDTMRGYVGDDSIYGGAGDDTIHGDDGNDGLYGHGGNDTIYGGAGDDWISGYDGDDTLYGGSGDDILSGESGNDTLYGDAGDDRMQGDDGDDTLHGGDGDDTLAGDDGDDTLYGGDGDDTLIGYWGDDTLYGGAGDDSISGYYGDDTFYGGSGNDRFYGHNGDDTLYGGAGDDYLWGGAGADIFVLGSDDDTVWDFTPSDGDKIRVAEFTGVIPGSIEAFLTAANLRVEKGHIKVEGFNSGRDSTTTENTAIYRGDTLVMVLEDFTDDLTLDMFDLPNAGINSAPEFAQESYSARLAENAATGSAVVTVQATDADAGDTLTYSIVSNNIPGLFVEDTIIDNAPPFAIDAQSGAITLTGTLDYETATSHSLTIKAQDNDGASAYTMVVVGVTDSNDNAPIFDVATHRVEIPETAEIGTTLTSVTARDADTSGVRYSILGGRNANLFSINENTGAITLKGFLDFETAESHRLVVQASDGVSTDTINVIIGVVDEMDCACLDISANTDEITVGTVLTASITDDDPNGYQGGKAPESGWFWFYQSKPDQEIGDGSATYTIKEQDSGEQICVRITYMDGNGRPEIVEARLEEVVQRVVIKPDAEDADKDQTYTAETDKATKVEAGTGADRVRDGMRNDVIDGGKGDDEIDLSASKEDRDEVIYGIGNQLASGGADKITSFVRGRDKFVFQLKQSDIDASGMSLSADSGLEQFAAYVTQGTADLRDDQFWVNLNFDLGGDVVTLSGISFHFQDSTFFSGARISMPIVSIEFADAVELDALKEMFSTSDAPVVNRQGLVIDLDYLDDILGGDDSVGFEII